MFRERECPLGRHKVHPDYPGAYLNDPVEVCLSCGWDSAGGCECPKDMTWRKYEFLQGQYFSLIERLGTKSDFQKFACEMRENK
jgi:hypothetical protein